ARPGGFTRRVGRRGDRARARDRGARCRAGVAGVTRATSSPGEVAGHAHAASPSLMVVGHGTRDADGLEEFWTLAGHVREAAGELPVGFGFIELAAPLVDTGIDELVAQGSREVVSVPLVLLAAGHLKNDGPA